MSEGLSDRNRPSLEMTVDSGAYIYKKASMCSVGQIDRSNRY